MVPVLHLLSSPMAFYAPTPLELVANGGAFSAGTVRIVVHYLDLTLDQVAETLGIPNGTARSRLHRAVAALRAAMEADARGPRESTPPAGEVAR